MKIIACLSHVFVGFMAGLLLVVLLIGISFFYPAHAIDPVDDLQSQIDQLAELKRLSEDATKPLEAQVGNLESQIANAQAGITAAQAESDQLAADIEVREEELADQVLLAGRRITEQYKRWRTYTPMLAIFAQSSASRAAKDLAYRNSVEVQDKQILDELQTEIRQLEEDRQSLAKRKKTLAALQVQLDDQAEFFRVEIAKAQEYQASLSGQIAQLSQQQQAIINARSGTFTTSVGEVPLTDDFNASIGFMSQAPNNSFAVFSFGAYTHRNGMSQYGAKARADTGQSVEEILKAYYPDAELKKNYSVPDTIDVQGYGRIPFEDDYLHKIYEMPASWNEEALKAQAIAARTYAIRHTNNGQGSICTTESCQVFKNSKKGGAWEEAVNNTRGWVLVDGSGNPVSTQYASTHGGYSNTSGWDTLSGSGSGDWTTEAWEKKANSPWFYKAWYRFGYSSSGPNCGRDHPWLSQQEMADIINAWMVRKNPNGADVNRIQPITINDCNIAGQGGNPYSMNELADKADDAGGAVSSISEVSVSHTSQAQTSQVTFQTNRGEIKIPGNEFKETFNLRAPGYIAIPQSRFAFFNIEWKR